MSISDFVKIAVHKIAWRRVTPPESHEHEKACRWYRPPPRALALGDPGGRA
jgi:hypothetical protein